MIRVNLKSRDPHTKRKSRSTHKKRNSRSRTRAVFSNASRYIFRKPPELDLTLYTSPKDIIRQRMRTPWLKNILKITATLAVIGSAITGFAIAANLPSMNESFNPMFNFFGTSIESVRSYITSMKLASLDSFSWTAGILSTTMSLSLIKNWGNIMMSKKDIILNATKLGLSLSAIITLVANASPIIDNLFKLNGKQILEAMLNPATYAFLSLGFVKLFIIPKIHDEDIGQRLYEDEVRVAVELEDKHVRNKEAMLAKLQKQLGEYEEQLADRKRMSRGIRNDLARDLVDPVDIPGFTSQLAESRDLEYILIGKTSAIQDMINDLRVEIAEEHVRIGTGIGEFGFDSIQRAIRHFSEAGNKEKANEQRVYLGNEFKKKGIGSHPEKPADLDLIKKAMRLFQEAERFDKEVVLRIFLGNYLLREGVRLDNRSFVEQASENFEYAEDYYISVDNNSKAREMLNAVADCGRFLE